MSWPVAKGHFKKHYASAFPPPTEVSLIVEALLSKAETDTGMTPQEKRLLDTIVADCEAAKRMNAELIRILLVYLWIPWFEGRKRYQKLFRRTFPPPVEINRLVTRIQSRLTNSSTLRTGREGLLRQIAEDCGGERDVERYTGPDIGGESGGA